MTLETWIESRRSALEREFATNGPLLLDHSEVGDMLLMLRMIEAALDEPCLDEFCDIEEAMQRVLDESEKTK